MILKPLEILRRSISEKPTHYAQNYGLSIKPEIRVRKESVKNMKNGLQMPLGTQNISCVLHVTGNLTRKKTGKIFGFVLPVFGIKMQVLNKKRICKLLLMIVIVVYNPNVKLRLEKRDL